MLKGVDTTLNDDKVRRGAGGAAASVRVRPAFDARWALDAGRPQGLRRSTWVLALVPLVWCMPSTAHRDLPCV